MAAEDGITDELVTSFEYRPGNESDHCFVSLTSGERLDPVDERGLVEAFF